MRGNQLHKYIFFIIIITSANNACKKKELDEKPSSSLVIPQTLSDFQELLDNDIIMNITPELGELSADDYYINYNTWLSADVKSKNAYIWAQDIYQGIGGVMDWNIPYQQIFYANIILEGLNKIPPTNANAASWKQIKGAALFSRAYAFYNLAQVFAPLFDSTTSSTDLALPIRLSSDVNNKSVRASVQDTYNQIITDLTDAKTLLLNTVDNNNNNRPSRPALMGLLARVYLSVRAYPQAGAYADSCLQLYSTVIDYNTIRKTATQPFPINNVETIYNSKFGATTIFGSNRPTTLTDTILYNSYDSNDLRKQIYFRFTNTDHLPYKKAGYGGASGYQFSGIVTDEMILIKAESEARSGNVSAAMKDLNSLLATRYITGKYVNMTADSEADGLSKILIERRKELIFRGQRWTDLRRLNKEGISKNLTRYLNGIMYDLPANDKRYVLPIPPDEILYSAIQQNLR